MAHEGLVAVTLVTSDVSSLTYSYQFNSAAVTQNEFHGMFVEMPATDFKKGWLQKVVIMPNTAPGTLIQLRSGREAARITLTRDGMVDSAIIPMHEATRQGLVVEGHHGERMNPFTMPLIIGDTMDILVPPVESNATDVATFIVMLIFKALEPI